MSEAAPTKTRVRKALTEAQTTARNARRRDLAAEARKTTKKASAKRVTTKKRETKRKTKRRTNLKNKATRRNWNDAIYKLQHGPKSKTIRHTCSTPGVAQVTRVRLLAAYDGIEAETKGATLIISRA